MRCPMFIAERLRQLRELKNLSQGDIERRTGLLRCYVSRVENGHTVPSLETLEKLARALEVKMYELLYEEPGTQQPANGSSNGHNDWATPRRGRRMLTKFKHALSRMSEKDRATLLFTAEKMVAARRRRAA
jgi:transcriptional regulator with XRE-family HTH domain